MYVFLQPLKSRVIFQEKKSEKLAEQISFLPINKISKTAWRILHDCLVRKEKWLALLHSLLVFTSLIDLCNPLALALYTLDSILNLKIIIF